MLATEYAKYYKIEPQQESEADATFRSRVSVTLRGMGHLFEAHEAYHDERYETNDNVMTGVFDAIAQALQDTKYSGDPIGNDLSAGTILHHQISPEGQQEAEAKKVIATMFGAGLAPDEIKKLLG